MQVVAILPSDPFAQLELAHKIAQAALAQKTAQMESEGQQLREALLQKQNQIKSLERRVSSLELELQDMVSKVSGLHVSAPPCRTPVVRARTVLPPRGGCTPVQKGCPIVKSPLPCRW